ncbi:MAG: elongation factor 1-alpha, partial [Candidatus Bathyarchaeota archaeon]|nr:elongation factor 1-alpha [Candidatus Bathyarchaeota archaeon]
KDDGIKRGDVCGLANLPPVAKTQFLGEILLLSGEVLKDESLFIKCATRKVKCRISKIIKKIDSETAKEINKDSEKLNLNEAAWVEFQLSKPVVIEKYSQVPALGRFILEKNEKNIGAGMVMDEQK